MNKGPLRHDTIYCRTIVKYKRYLKCLKALQISLLTCLPTYISNSMCNFIYISLTWLGSYNSAISWMTIANKVSINGTKYSLVWGRTRKYKTLLHTKFPFNGTTALSSIKEYKLQIALKFWIIHYGWRRGAMLISSKNRNYWMWSDNVFVQSWFFIHFTRWRNCTYLHVFMYTYEAGVRWLGRMIVAGDDDE